MLNLWGIPQALVHNVCWGLSQAISSNVTFMHVVYIDKTEWVGTLLSKQCAGRMFEQAVQLLQTLPGVQLLHAYTSSADVT